MTLREEMNKLRQNLPDRWWDQFESAGPNSAKIRCIHCLRTGWGSLYAEWGITPWQLRCLMGHDAACPKCDRRFVNNTGLTHHLRAHP